MHASRTLNHAHRRRRRLGQATAWSASFAAWRVQCPYCVWFLLGLVLLMSAPGLAATQTPVGALWLWLAVLPIGSALLRRVLMR